VHFARQNTIVPDLKVTITSALVRGLALDFA
jgi:hypothetical protein